MALNLINDQVAGVQSLANKPIRTTIIDLSIPQDGYIINAAGNNFYISNESTGIAVIDPASLNVGLTESLAPIVATRQTYFQGGFTSLKLSWIRQTGARLVIITGDFYLKAGDTFVTPIQEQTNEAPPFGTRVAATGRTGVLQTSIASVGNTIGLNSGSIIPSVFFKYAAVEIKRLTADFVIKYAAGVFEKPSNFRFSIFSTNSVAINAGFNASVIVDQVLVDATGVYLYCRVDHVLIDPLVVPKENNANGINLNGVITISSLNAASTSGISSMGWQGLVIV
jgi:hypothetical protein